MNPAGAVDAKRDCAADQATMSRGGEVESRLRVCKRCGAGRSGKVLARHTSDDGGIVGVLRVSSGRVQRMRAAQRMGGRPKG